MKNNTHQNTPRNKQSGLTLIEIMIAVTLSLLLLGGLVQIVVGNQQTYKVQDAMARVQENGRFSLHFLSKDIRMAGFTGCSNITGGLAITNNVNPAGTGGNQYTEDVDGAIQAFDGTSAVVGYSYTTGSLPTELSSIGLTNGTNVGDVMEDTDLLFIRRAGSCPGATVKQHNNNAATMQIASNATCNLQQNDIVMVTNCETADIFGISNTPGTGDDATVTHGANWNDSPQLDNGYGADSFILKMKSMVFYIGVGASGEPALFKRDLAVGALTSNELVEGMEDMSILYGEDLNNDGTADTYVAAGSVVNMENVVSLRITMVSRTLEDGIASQSNGTDRRIRRNFTTTVGIRNRIS